MSDWYENGDSYESTKKEQCPTGEHIFRVTSAEKGDKDGRKFLLLTCEPQIGEDEVVAYYPIKLFLNKNSQKGISLMGWMCDDVGKITGKRPNNPRELDEQIRILNKSECLFKATVEINTAGFPAIERSSIGSWGVQAPKETETPW